MENLPNDKINDADFESQDSDMQNEQPERTQAQKKATHTASHTHASHKSSKKQVSEKYAKRDVDYKESKKSKGNDDAWTFSQTALWRTVSVVLLVLLVLVIVLKPAFLFGAGSSAGAISEEQAKQKTLDFVNNNLLAAQGLTARVDSITTENDLYKMVITVDGPQGGSITSYLSKDGKVFFPQGMELVPAAGAPTGNVQQQAPPEVPKTEKPVVEVFVMSHCPYGTQTEKGILPVVGLLGEKADIQIKFVNYAMHGKTEIDEQVNQYCIQQEYPDDYFKYLQCFLTEGNTAQCVSDSGFDQEKLDSCIEATDAEFGITEAFNDQSTWLSGRYPKFMIHNEDNLKYGVQGSPTIVINGESVSVSRDSNSLKNAICNAFTTAPEECSTELPTASPSPGFGYGTSGTDSAAANCGV